MSMQKINYISLFYIFLLLICLCFMIFQAPQIAKAQLWGFSNPWATSSLWNPFQNFGQTSLQNLWQTPYQNQWGNPWSFSWQSPWQYSYQSPWQNPWQYSYQSPWQNQWQNPSQYAWQNPSQYPWQYPSQYGWQNPWANPYQSQYQNADVELDASDDNSTVTVSVGERISIILASNASTGFKWVLDENVLKSSIVSKIGSQYFPGQTNLVGSGGSEQWIF